MRREFRFEKADLCRHFDYPESAMELVHYELIDVNGNVCCFDTIEPLWGSGIDPVDVTERVDCCILDVMQDLFVEFNWNNYRLAE